MTPYDMDERRFCDVMNLFIDVRKLQIREKKARDPNRVIRRKAGDDWF